MATVRALACAERETFADLLESLTPQQWDAPSLCAGWTVRDVATHTIAYLGQGRIALARNMFAARWDVGRLNANALARLGSVQPGRLIELMRRAEPTGAGALYGGRVALIECLVHQQDIRRPLRMPRAVDPEALRAALAFARISPVIRGARRTRGLRLVATDLDWAAGRGPEVRGTGEALLLAMTGRAAHLSGELAGGGVALLDRR
ncbi:maleylpyruvate isomerase family mycothiol-dependent enzyme [Mycobacterium hackensackense]|uniref:maleylpyruvate isomerase family mycothiol-dependent enzyme n=1 Tax=Mycobacterium hackensackense TaxID=228909 RepID=UPI002265E8C7|nr:maleylpyruvate isomerase family mycothiol-dependent enzyme [Mycobacterium hackensackense]MCV7253131.1 maleylpyruvate isomerase family mycothiol-dependent enzyme [Mycobacterium hackensackense]